MATLETETKKVTYEEFLEQTDENVHAEWVDGSVIPMSPASTLHQDLLGFLSAILRNFVEENELGKVLAAPFQMKLEVRPSGREPDLIFIRQENLSRLKETYLDGPADLAIEIISPESRGRDRGDKFYEYEQSGVAEYWLLDSERKQEEFYQLKDGFYQLVRPENFIYPSSSIKGLWLDVRWLRQRPFPKVMTILKAWKLV
jgi:Uma2 family endonuclease